MQIFQMSSTGKKFVNDADRAVDEALEGLARSNAQIRQHAKCGRVLLRADYEEYANAGKVALIAGGGSGHEPFAAGYLGAGLLTAAVCGGVFASPPSASVLRALEVTKSPAGAVVLLINYTGDRLNFGLAVERFKKYGGRAVLVAIDDDVAFEGENGRVGARGLAGAVLAIKIAGAMAESGKTMDDIATYARQVTARCATLGVSLQACSLPGRGRMFELEADKMELGLGIHGERGRERTEFTNARGIVATMMETLLRSEKITHTPSLELALLLNNLGSVSNLELGVVRKEIISYLDSRKIRVKLLYVGTFMTSIDAHGISITLLRVNENDIGYLEHETTAEAWTKALKVPEHIEAVCNESRIERKEIKAAKLRADEAEVLRGCIHSACGALKEAREVLNELDGAAGDGDCGDTIAQAVNAILAEDTNLDWYCPANLLSQLALIFQNSAGGTGGALYAIFLEAASACLVDSAYKRDWLLALHSGLDAIMRYGGARPGDRTMVDALSAAAAFVGRGKMTKKELLKGLRDEVKHAAEATATMRAGVGRASYVTREAQTKADAGATAVAIWIDAIVQELLEKCV